MLYRIAITPDVFTDAGLSPDGGKMLSPLWGIFQDNGLLADFNEGEWAMFVKGMNLSPSIRDRVISHLCRIKDKNRIINCELPELHASSINDYLILAKTAKEKDLIDYLIYGEKYRLSSEVQEGMQIEDTIEFPIEFSDPVFRKISEAKSWQLKKTEADLSYALSRLFGYARMATIVDPFLNCKHKYYQRSLFLLTTILSKNNNHNTERYLNIYTSKKKSGFTNKQFDEFWAPFLRNLANEFKINISMKILGASIQTQEQLHDRFLFSEQCGISIPSDFTVDQKGKERNATWNLLTIEKYSNLVKELYAELNYPVKMQKNFFPKKFGEDNYE